MTPIKTIVEWVKEKRQYHHELASPKAFVSQRLSDFHRAEAIHFDAILTRLTAPAPTEGHEAALAHERNNTAYWQSQAEALARRIAAFRAELFFIPSGCATDAHVFDALKRHHLDRVTPEDATAIPDAPQPSEDQ
jgi:hypothetical protein